MRTYKKGISLIVLVITIVVIVVLATAVIMNLLGDKNIIQNAKDAVDTSNKQTATEKMNLKLTTIQVDSYTKKQRLPTLQEVANILSNDGEVNTVSTDSKYKKISNNEIASLSADINIGTSKSIYVILNEFPYEFEINDSLQLASINGVDLIADSSNNEDSESTDTKYAALEQRIVDLENRLNSTAPIGEYYETTFGQITIPANTATSVVTLKDLPAGTYILTAYTTYDKSDGLRYHLQLGDSFSSAYDNSGYVRMNITTIKNFSSDSNNVPFYVYPSKNITLTGGFIRAVKIGA